MAEDSVPEGQLQTRAEGLRSHSGECRSGQKESKARERIPHRVGGARPRAPGRPDAAPGAISSGGAVAGHGHRAQCSEHLSQELGRWAPDSRLIGTCIRELSSEIENDHTPSKQHSFTRERS